MLKLEPPAYAIGANPDDYDLTNYTAVKTTEGYCFHRKPEVVLQEKNKNEKEEFEMVKRRASKFTAKNVVIQSQNAKKVFDEHTSSGRLPKGAVAGVIIPLLKAKKYSDNAICEKMQEAFPEKEEKQIRAFINWYRSDYNKKNPDNQVVRLVETSDGSLIPYIKGSIQDSVPTVKSEKPLPTVVSKPSSSLRRRRRRT